MTQTDAIAMAMPIAMQTDHRLFVKGAVLHPAEFGVFSNLSPNDVWSVVFEYGQNMEKPLFDGDIGWDDSPFFYVDIDDKSKRILKAQWNCDTI